MVTDLINRIIAEAVKTLALSVKILGYGFWYGGIGLVAGIRKLLRWQEDRSLQSNGPSYDNRQGVGVVCPACGTTNEAGERTCFACGSTL